METARNAIAAMQQGSGPAFVQASQWLIDFEHSAEAWGVAWELVSGEGTSIEDSTYRFFGAKIVYSKIQRDFDQLGQDQIADFTQKLVARVIDLSQKYGEEVSFVVCRYLCLSIAAMALQVNQEGVVNQILIWFNPILQSAPRVMLELLYLLPEECDNSSILVERDTRDNFAYQLTQSFSDVVSFLQSLMESPASTDSTKIRIMKCLAAWVQCTFVGASQVAVHPTFDAALASLHSPNPEVMEAGVEVLIESFQRFGSSSEEILAKALPAVVNLIPLWQQASSSPECEDGDPAYDVCKHISRLVTEVADNCTGFILRPSTDAAMNQYKQGIFQLLLECCRHPEDDISCIPLWFIDNFTADITDVYLTHMDEQDGNGRGRRNRDGPSAAEEWKYVNESYFGHLMTFLHSCTLQCARLSAPCIAKSLQAVLSGQAGTDGSSLQPEVGLVVDEECEDQRKRWHTAVMNVSSLIDRVHGPDAPMLALAESLRQNVEESRSVVVADASQVEAASIILGRVEAHLYLLTAGLPYIDRREAQATPWLFENVFLAACPTKVVLSGAAVVFPASSVPQLFSSILRCIGATSKWLTEPQHGARYLPQSLALCSSQLAHALFQKSAASSLKALLCQCGHIDGAQDEAMKIHSMLLEARRKELPLSADLHLLEGVCNVLCAFSDKVNNGVDEQKKQQLHGYLVAVLEPMISTLNVALGLPPPPPHSSPMVNQGGQLQQQSAADGDKTRDGVIISLERLCLVLRCLRLQPELYMSLLQHQVLSLLQSLLENRPYSSRLCEKVCRCYKHAMRNASHAFAPLLPALLQHLSLQFSRQHDAGYIYITAIAVGEYCRGCVYDPTCAPGPLLIEAISAITDDFFKRFGSPEAFAESPDVVEEYFCLLQKTLQVAPALYFSMASSNRDVASLGRTFVEIVYPACIAALHTSHRDVHKAACQLFLTLVTIAEGRGSREDGEGETRLRRAALSEIRNGASRNLVAAVFQFLASQESKVALGGETDKLGLLLLSISRVLARDAKDQGRGGDNNAEMSEWLHHAVTGLESMPSSAAVAAAAAAASGDGGGGPSGGGGGGGGMKPSAAISKTDVCELILRGEEDSALDATYRFHRAVVGGRE